MYVKIKCTQVTELYIPYVLFVAEPPRQREIILQSILVTCPGVRVLGCCQHTLYDWQELDGNTRLNLLTTYDISTLYGRKYVSRQVCIVFQINSVK